MQALSGVGLWVGSWGPWGWCASGDHSTLMVPPISLPLPVKSRFLPATFRGSEASRFPWVYSTEPWCWQGQFEWRCQRDLSRRMQFGACRLKGGRRWCFSNSHRNAANCFWGGAAWVLHHPVFAIESRSASRQVCLAKVSLLRHWWPWSETVACNVSWELARPDLAALRAHHGGGDKYSGLRGVGSGPFGEPSTDDRVGTVWRQCRRRRE